MSDPGAPQDPRAVSLLALAQARADLLRLQANLLALDRALEGWGEVLAAHLAPEAPETVHPGVQQILGVRQTLEEAEAALAHLQEAAGHPPEILRREEARRALARAVEVLVAAQTAGRG